MPLTKINDPQAIRRLFILAVSIACALAAYQLATVLIDLRTTDQEGRFVLQAIVRPFFTVMASMFGAALFASKHPTRAAAIAVIPVVVCLQGDFFGFIGMLVGTIMIMMAEAIGKLVRKRTLSTATKKPGM